MCDIGAVTEHGLLLSQDYPKVSQSYYGLLEALTQDHMEFVSTLEPEVCPWRASLW